MTATKWKSVDDRKEVARLIGYMASEKDDYLRHKHLTRALLVIERNFGGGSESIEVGTVGGVTYYRVMLSGTHFIDTKR